MPQAAPNLSQYLYAGPEVAYTTDPTQQASALAALQAYAQANPNDPTAQAMLAEQQNVISYANNQGQVSQLSGQLANVQSLASQYAGSSNQGPDTSSWGAIESNIPAIINYYNNSPGFQGQLNDVSQGAITNVSQLQQYLSKPNGNNNPLIYNGELAAALKAYVPVLQNQINAATSGQNTAQNTLIAGYTLPAVNAPGALSAESQYLYGPNGQPVTAANEGAINATLDPLVADAYRTRYVATQGLNEQMNQSGNLNSGSQVGAQQKVGQQTMGQLSNDSNALYNQGAQQMTGLANTLSGVQQNEGQNLQSTKQAQTGAQFLNSANTNQNDWLSNFNTGISQSLNSENNNFNQALANQSSVSTALGGAASIIANAL